MMHSISTQTRNQRGAVLIVALVLLLVLTLLGTAGIQDTTMEERMVGNFLDESVALEAAEAALREAETERLGLPTAEFDATSKIGFDNADPGYFAFTEDDRNIIPGDTGDFLLAVTDPDSWHDLVDQRPDYYIERLPPSLAYGSSIREGEVPDWVQFYRATARGFGVSPKTEVILQSTFYRSQ